MVGSTKGLCVAMLLALIALIGCGSSPQRTDANAISEYCLRRSWRPGRMALPIGSPPGRSSTCARRHSALPST